MSNRFIGVGFVLAFLALISIVIGVGQLGVRGMDSLHADARNIAEQQWMNVQLVSEALDYSDQNSQINMQILLSRDQPDLHSLLARRAENSARISTLLALLQARAGSRQEQKLLDAILDARKDYLDSYQRATGLFLEQNKAEEARKILIQETFPRLLKYHSAYCDYERFQNDAMNQELARSAARYASARKRALYLVAFSVLLAVGIAVVVVRIAGEIVRRKTAENHMRRMNEELEVQVLQRTAALEKSNRDLSAEIAERKRSEELVRRLSTAVEQSPVSVVISDVYGEVTYVNRKFVESTGYDFEEVVGQSVRILRSGPQAGEEYKRIFETVTAGNEWRGEFCNQKKDGDLYWESAFIRPLRDEEGNITHILSIREDITERRIMQSQLQQAQKLEAVGQLAAGIAHEINTPMQFIGDNIRFVQQAWSSLCGAIALCCAVSPSAVDEATLRQVVQGLEAADFKYLQEEIPAAIEQSLDGVQRVSKIVRAMKEFSHPGSEEKKLADINHAIETTVTVARNEWKYVADLETSLSGDVGLVLFHVGEFNQVILNLLVNAAHAIADVVGDGSRGKGKITIRTAREQDWVQISVQDTGCGIPLAVQSRVFDPFFTTKEPGKGTGQGLALAYAVIVKKHGGSIWFETKPGEGTTFFIRLPAQPATGDLHQNKTELAIPRQG